MEDDEEMEIYPIYRALYEPVLFAGVPLLILITEICIGLLCMFLISIWMAIPILIIHILIRFVFSIDPYIVPILLSLISNKGDEKR